MTNITKPELKPCPFCGEDAVLGRYDDTGETYAECRNTKCGNVYKHVSTVLWSDRAPQWQHISKAPRDGTLIDVWCPSMHTTARGVRLTCVAWHDADEIYEKTGWVRVLDDGDWDFVTGPAESSLGLPPWTPTHWMHLPEAPEVE